MSDEALARRRYFTIVLVRIAGTAGAIFGLILIGRAPDLPSKILGVLIVLAALAMIASVPRALAHRWRSGAE